MIDARYSDTARLCARRAALMAFVGTLLFAGWVLADVAERMTFLATVHRDDVPLHVAPDANSEPLRLLPRGQRTTWISQQGPWYLLALDDGTQGYVRPQHVRLDSLGEDGVGQAFDEVLTGGHVTRSRETAGVRGIGEVALRRAHRADGAFRNMAQYQASSAEATLYAHEQGLQVQADFVLPASSAAPPDMRGRRGPRARREVPAAPQGPGDGYARAGEPQPGNRFTSQLRAQFRQSLGDAEILLPRNVDEHEEAERQIGPEVAARLLAVNPPVNDAGVQHHVNRVGRLLADQSGRPDLSWLFGVVRSDEFNAYAAPGGYVFITEPMYRSMSNDHELAAILAHEIAHVVFRDHYEVMRKQRITDTSVAMLAGRLGLGSGQPSRPDVGQLLAAHGAAILITRLDQDAEFRADRFGLQLMIRSGFDASGYYSVLQKLHLVSRTPSAVTQLYRSHPGAPARMDALDPVFERLNGG